MGKEPNTKCPGLRQRTSKALKPEERKEKSKSQKNLIAMKLESIEQIAQASGLSVEEVLKLAEKN